MNKMQHWFTLMVVCPLCGQSLPGGSSLQRHINNCHLQKPNNKANLPPALCVYVEDTDPVKAEPAEGMDQDPLACDELVTQTGENDELISPEQDTKENIELDIKAE